MSDKTMPLLEHLVELRNVLIKSVFALLSRHACGRHLYAADFAVPDLPVRRYPANDRPDRKHLDLSARVDHGGAVITMPIFVYLLWSFIAPGLEKNEKRYVYIVVPGATVLFLIGVAFAWGIMLPAAIGFLSTFQSEIFKSDWRADAYIPFVTSLMFWIGVSFETPLIIFFLAKLHVVTASMLLKGWRFAIVIIAVVAAMITPTVDPFNMLLVMAPLILLYFFSVLLAKLA